MHKNKTAVINTGKIIFCLAVLLFVAKPFIGFNLLSSAHPPIEIHNILVKCFSKRKPEELKDAELRAAAIQQQLANPPAVLGIAIFLVFLFPFAFKPEGGVTSHFLSDIYYRLQPAECPYLLIGKLSI
jgi:hypothetical protein